MDIKVNENTNQMNNGQKQKRKRRSHKEVAFEKIKNHIRIIEKHKKAVKKWLEEIDSTRDMISCTVARLRVYKSYKSDEEKERFTKQLEARLSTLKKKMCKLERAKLRLEKKQKSATKLYKQLVDEDIFDVLQFEYTWIATEFESIVLSAKAYDIEKIVSDVDGVLNACSNITAAPDDITWCMLYDLTNEISKVIDFIEVNEIQTVNDAVIIADDYTEAEKKQIHALVKRKDLEAQEYEQTEKNLNKPVRLTA